MDGWLAELGLAPEERAERDGVVSWDLLLDGRRRVDIRLTLILEPATALHCWVHFAPPLNDSFRVSFRQFLRWNDELPFVKFALGSDERPVLIAELPLGALDRDALGLAICRLLAVCDLLLPESVRWLWPGARQAPAMDRPSRAEHLFARYAARLPELIEAAAPDVPELHR
ncbi:hypothetical protein BH24CHL9_BH24CHL9_13160 [soil metagenome]